MPDVLSYREPEPTPLRVRLPKRLVKALVRIVLVGIVCLLLGLAYILYHHFYGATVHVQDTQGRPIAGADVEVVALSMGVFSGKTDANGEITFGTLYAQAPQWLYIRKDGFVGVDVNFPTTWPYTVTLHEGSGTDASGRR